MGGERLEFLPARNMHHRQRVMGQGALHLADLSDGPVRLHHPEGFGGDHFVHGAGGRARAEATGDAYLTPAESAAALSLSAFDVLTRRNTRSPYARLFVHDEQRVLQHMALDMEDADIAASTGLARSSISKHSAALLAKLEAGKDRTQAVIKGIEVGALPWQVVEPGLRGRALESADVTYERLITERDRPVLFGLALGQSESEIARALRRSDAQTHADISRIIAKLGANDRLHATVLWLAHDERMRQAVTEQWGPAVPAHALTGEEQRALYMLAIGAGADADPSAIATAQAKLGLADGNRYERDRNRLRAVMATLASGSVPWSPVLQIAQQHRGRYAADVWRRNLTPDEWTALNLIAHCRTNAQIGEHLGKDADAASRLVSSAVEKLGATGRTDAVLLARAGGLLRWDEEISPSIRAQLAPDLPSLFQRLIDQRERQVLLSWAIGSRAPVSVDQANDLGDLMRARFAARSREELVLLAVVHDPALRALVVHEMERRDEPTVPALYRRLFEAPADRNLLLDVASGLTNRQLGRRIRRTEGHAGRVVAVLLSRLGLGGRDPAGARAVWVGALRTEELAEALDTREAAVPNMTKLDHKTLRQLLLPAERRRVPRERRLRVMRKIGANPEVQAHALTRALKGELLSIPELGEMLDVRPASGTPRPYRWLQEGDPYEVLTRIAAGHNYRDIETALQLTRGQLTTVLNRVRSAFGDVKTTEAVSLAYLLNVISLKEVLKLERPYLGSDDMDLLHQIAAGQQDKTIASARGVSPDVVSRLVKEICGAMGVQSRAEAISWAYLFGWLPPPVLGEIPPTVREAYRQLVSEQDIWALLQPVVDRAGAPAVEAEVAETPRTEELFARLNVQTTPEAFVRALWLGLIPTSPAQLV